MAYAGNPALQSERAKLRSVDEGVPEALSDWRPTAAIQADAGKSHQQFDSDSASLNPADASLTVTQPLYNGGSTTAATKAAEETVLQERAQLTVVEQTVLVNAATAYLDIVQDQQILDLYTANEATLKNWVQETGQRFKMGELTRTDVSQTESRLARAHADRNEAEVNLNAARSAYARFTGQMPGTLTKPAFSQVLPLSRDDALLAAHNLAPAVLAADHAARAGDANINVVRGNLLPRVALLGSVKDAHDENAPQQGIAQNHAQNDQVLVQVVIPLYTGGGDYARLHAAYQDRSQKLRDMDEAKREAEEGAAQAWDRMQMTTTNITWRQSQVTAAETALEGMKQEERLGDRTSTDTLNAEQELLDSKVAKLQAEHDHAVATVQLLAAVGDFTAAKLKLKTDLYNPEKHYVTNRNRLIGIGDVDGK